MKKSSIFSVLVLLAALLMFAGCDGLGETTTYVTVEAEDGFTLEESNISFNASTSVSSSSTVDD
ncbi:MAG: hypothetical protein PQJ59_13935, partial [Spirochaetales bacterium]|nr:hypothetical protein [Spirochaetales bacterium]